MNALICIYRQAFRCKRRLCPSPHRTAHKRDIRVTDIPWLWIGAKYHDRTVTVTDVVNEYISQGVHLTPCMLEEITGSSPESWVYVDAKTLEERVFPSDGIVIDGHGESHYVHGSK